MRNLTIRRVRPADGEVDIEFAVHGDSPMAVWVRGVEPGDPAGIFDMGTTYRRPDHAEAHEALPADREDPRGAP